jgi:flagellar biosynthesis protein FliR
MVAVRRYIVQTRLFACLAGGLIGVVVASPVSTRFEVGLTLAAIGCVAVGVAIGYVVSIFFDIFAASPDDKSAES